MSYRYERYERRRKSRVGCLAWLVALVWIVFLGLLAYRMFGRQPVSEYIGEQIGGQLRGVGQQTTPFPIDQLQEGAEHAMPTVISALPSGEVRITEEQANSYMQANAGALRPIDSVSVRFVPGEMQATIRAAGLSSTARMGLAVQDGRVIAVNPRIDGILGQVVSAETLTNALQQQINNDLAAQGRRITDVRIEQGQIIAVID